MELRIKTGPFRDPQPHPPFSKKVEIFTYFEKALGLRYVMFIVFLANLFAWPNN